MFTPEQLRLAAERALKMIMENRPGLSPEEALLDFNKQTRILLGDHTLNTENLTSAPSCDRVSPN